MLAHLDLLAFILSKNFMHLQWPKSSTQVKTYVRFFSSPFPAYNVDNWKQQRQIFYLTKNSQPLVFFLYHYSLALIIFSSQTQRVQDNKN